MHNFKRCAAIAAATGALLLSISGHEARAVSLDIDSVTGAWSDVTGTPFNLQGVGTTAIHWGDPVSSGGPQSGYIFSGVAPPPVTGIPANSPFNLGTFTHDNQTIQPGGSITGARLTITISGTAHDGGDDPFTKVAVFDFTHDETPNVSGSCPPLSVSVCDDIVTIATNVGGSQLLTVDGVDYIFAFSGFLIGGNPFTQFLTQEGQPNIATIEGILIQQSLVPLPAALPLFATGLGALGLLGWRRKRKPQATA